MALTVTETNNTKPKEKAFKLYDEAGLFMQVTPSGCKLWRFKYCYEGKEKLLSIGTYPEVPLVDARVRRDKARKLLAKSLQLIQVQTAKPLRHKVCEII